MQNTYRGKIISADWESRSKKDRCDWMLNPQVFQQIQLLMGPLQTNLFASRLMKQLPNFYSWRPDLEATATDAFNQNWAQTRGFTNLHGASMPESDRETNVKSGDDHSSLGITTMVPNDSGNVGGLSQNSTCKGRSSDTPTQTGIHNEPRSTGASGMAHIWESFKSQGISSEASALLLASWRPKTQSNYDSLFSK